MFEGMACVLARAAEAAFFVCGKDGRAGKKCRSEEGSKFCEGGESVAEECAAKKESTRRRNSSGSSCRPRCETREARPKVVWGRARRRRSSPNDGRARPHPFHRKSGGREKGERRRLLPVRLPRPENRRVFRRDTAAPRRRERRESCRARGIFADQRNRKPLRGDRRKKLRRRRPQCGDRRPRIAARCRRPWIRQGRRGEMRRLRKQRRWRLKIGRAHV